MGTGNTYPQFEYTATELSAYLLTAGIFTIRLKNGTIIHYIPDDAPPFEQWLIHHNIRNVRTSLN